MDLVLPEIWTLISRSFLTKEERVHLARTCRFLYSLAGPICPVESWIPWFAAFHRRHPNWAPEACAALYRQGIHLRRAPFCVGTQGTRFVMRWRSKWKRGDRGFEHTCNLLIYPRSQPLKIYKQDSYGFTEWPNYVIVPEPLPPGKTQALCYEIRFASRYRGGPRLKPPKPDQYWSLEEAVKDYQYQIGEEDACED